ncbi:MAG TPA: hypothetical protein P5256_09000 [Beijerinckiaceae bacterium]|nr:hypothetical protein [Rhodoblastus sp.]MCB1524093.1 hypothetical protein [Rhodoblastus sp.]MCB9997945.1 hypothetical protein [Methylobacteriaceae bacterium]MCO5086187.1 hypothetical protein [Methylobacteriaceae bacterium]HRY03252.1 hypothetical protein [Beijerinckiaceae bacterium]
MRVLIGPAGAAILAMTLAAPALAEGAASTDPTENGRYSMTPTDGGFLRLDTRTGAVSLCKVVSGSAVCRAATEERAALQGEIDRLTKQNEALKQQKSGDSSLPSKQDFDRALDYAERFMRRMMRIMRDEEPDKNKT